MGFALKKFWKEGGHNLDVAVGDLQKMNTLTFSRSYRASWHTHKDVIIFNEEIV